VKLNYTWEEIENWRDRRYRRLPRLAVRTKSRAIDFVNSVGFCFAFKSDHSELPCLWHAACGTRSPVMPRHTHSDPYVSFVWEMKNVLPAENTLYYGKVLKRRPTLVALEYLPSFYVLAGRTGNMKEYQRQYLRGGLSPSAKLILDSLLDSSPQVTKALRIATNKHLPGARVDFDKAMGELQAKMYVVKTAEHYSPFTFEWDLVDRRYAAAVRRARNLSHDGARRKVLAKYFENQLVATVRSIQSLFGWPRQEVYKSLGELVGQGVITANVTVEGKNRIYYRYVS
jgi:hypothetical protein